MESVQASFGHFFSFCGEDIGLETNIRSIPGFFDLPDDALTFSGDLSVDFWFFAFPMILFCNSNYVSIEIITKAQEKGMMNGVRYAV